MNYVTHSFVLAVIVALAIPTAGICGYPDAERQVIFQTATESIFLPDEDRAFELDEVTFRDSCIRAVLADNSCESIRMAFRNFDLSDTIGVRDDGTTVRLSDMR